MMDIYIDNFMKNSGKSARKAEKVGGKKYKDKIKRELLDLQFGVDIDLQSYKDIFQID